MLCKCTPKKHGFGHGFLVWSNCKILVRYLGHCNSTQSWAYRVVYQAQVAHIDLPCRWSFQIEVRKYYLKGDLFSLYNLTVVLASLKLDGNLIFAAQCILNAFLVLSAELKVREKFRAYSIQSTFFYLLGLNMARGFPFPGLLQLPNLFFYYTSCIIHISCVVKILKIKHCKILELTFISVFPYFPTAYAFFLIYRLPNVQIIFTYFFGWEIRKICIYKLNIRTNALDVNTYAFYLSWTFLDSNHPLLNKEGKWFGFQS